MASGWNFQKRRHVRDEEWKLLIEERMKVGQEKMEHTSQPTETVPLAKRAQLKGVGYYRIDAES